MLYPPFVTHFQRLWSHYEDVRERDHAADTERTVLINRVVISFVGGLVKGVCVGAES